MRLIKKCEKDPPGTTADKVDVGTVFRYGDPGQGPYLMARDHSTQRLLVVNLCTNEVRSADAHTTPLGVIPRFRPLPNAVLVTGEE